MNSTELLNLFEVANPLPDEVIEANTSPLFDLDQDVFLVVPSYMAWCLAHDHRDGNIVIDGTISALSELGRSKFSSEGNARFKYQCTRLQIEAVITFLKWCLSIEPLIHEHTERAIKQWSKPINKSSNVDAFGASS